MPRTILEEGTNYRVYDDGTLLIQNVRFSYPHVDAPWSKKEGEKKKYSVVGLMPKKTHRAAKDAIKAFYTKNIMEPKKIKAMASKDIFLRDGNDSGKAEYDGHYTINASESPDRPPSVRGANTKPVPLDKIKALVKPGHWGDILIRPWFQDNEHGKKINAGLVALQWKRKDEEFGEGSISEDDIDETFDAVSDDESGFDEDDDYDGL